MANVFVNDESLTAIGDAIREKNGESTKYLPADMAAAILALSVGGDGGASLTLPDGYAMEMGLYVPASDIQSAVTVDLKNTFRWADSGKTSACYLALFGVDLRSGIQAAGAGLHVKFGTGERNHQMVQTGSGCSTSSTVFISPSTTTTFNSITITGTGSYPLKTGISYLWLVIGELAS